ncbi:vesicle transport protein USE1 isoform X1 [Chrysemys picta bellii]|uniref:vesicle transport protein USE1 isoform X1 n=2 Tax=Chrysemys picta bellii TaxID=8478 RepID=UPI0032B263BD
MVSPRDGDCSQMGITSLIHSLTCPVLMASCWQLSFSARRNWLVVPSLRNQRASQQDSSPVCCKFHEGYVGALEEMLLALKKHSSKPARELLNEYSRKVDFLKGMLEAEKLLSSAEKALANQFLAPGRTPTTTKERTPATKMVHLQTKARYTGKMRSELLGTDPLSVNESEELNLRKRKGLASEEKQSATELDAVLQHHRSMQEKLAEEMLSLARSLKNNTLAAQNVIKQDNQTLSHSLRMADHNFEKLKDESERLEQHAKKSVNWLLWIMLIVVCFIFISMILFIRIFPKLR